MKTIPETREQRGRRLRRIIVELRRRIDALRGCVSDDVYTTLEDTRDEIFIEGSSDVDALETRLERLQQLVRDAEAQAASAEAVTVEEVRVDTTEEEGADEEGPVVATTATGHMPLAKGVIYTLVALALGGLIRVLTLRSNSTGESENSSFSLDPLLVVMTVLGGVIFFFRKKISEGIRKIWKSDDVQTSTDKKSTRWKFIIPGLVVIALLASYLFMPSWFEMGWGTGGWVLAALIAGLVILIAANLLLDSDNEAGSERKWKWKWILGTAGVILLVAGIILAVKYGLLGVAWAFMVSNPRPFQIGFGVMVVAIIVSLIIYARHSERLWSTLANAVMAIIFVGGIVLVVGTIAETVKSVSTYRQTPPKQPADLLSAPKDWTVTAPVGSRVTVETPRGWRTDWRVTESKPTSIVAYADGVKYHLKPGDPYIELPEAKIWEFESGEVDRPTKVQIIQTKLE